MFAKVGFRKKQASAPGPSRVPKATYYQGSYQTKTESSPFKKRLPSKPKFKSQLTKIVDWFVVLAVLFCLIYSLIIKPEPRVLSNSWVYRPASTYNAFAAKNASAILDRNKLTFNEGQLVERMQKQFPEISTAWVEVPIVGQKPTVHLTISPPSFVYSAGNTSYILDADGVIIGTLADTPNIKNLTTIIDQSNIPIKVGAKVISSQSVDFINQVIAQAKVAKVTVSNVVLPAVAQEIQLRTSDKPYYVKFYFGNDVLVQTGQWLAARHEFQSKNINPTEYLDVRVPGKVFYK